MEWFDQEFLVSEELSLIGDMPLYDTEYIINAYNAAGCIKTRNLTVTVDQTIRYYVPNILIQSSATNNQFIVGSNAAIQSLNELNIYDRWGNLIHHFSGNMYDYKGWDGRVDGKLVEQGVYTYVIEFGVANGESFIDSGSITVIR